MSLLFYLWSKTAATNATADAAINWAEGQAPSSVNDSARAMMASAAGFRDDNAGSLTTGGTSTAFTLTTNQVFDTLAHLSGQKLCVKFNATNGAAATLNVDTLGGKALQTLSGTAIPTGMILANSIWDVTYDNSIPAFIVHGIPAVLGGQAFSANITPATNDGAALGTTALEWSDLFLASGSVINWNNGDVLATHSANTLAFSGASSGYTFDAAVAATNFTISGNSVLTTASVAAQSDQETASSTTTYVSPGRQQSHPSSLKARAYIVFSGGTPSIADTFNVASVTDNGVGDTTLTLTTNFSSANYTVVPGLIKSSTTGVSNASYIEVAALSVSTIRIKTYSVNVSGANTILAAADIDFSVMAAGDQ